MPNAPYAELRCQLLLQLPTVKSSEPYLPKPRDPMQRTSKKNGDGSWSFPLPDRA